MAGAGGSARDVPLSVGVLALTPRRARAQVQEIADAISRLDLTWRWVRSLGAAERAAAFEEVRCAARGHLRAWVALPRVRPDPAPARPRQVNGYWELLHPRTRQ